MFERKRPTICSQANMIECKLNWSNAINDEYIHIETSYWQRFRAWENEYCQASFLAEEVRWSVKIDAAINNHSFHKHARDVLYITIVKCNCVNLNTFICLFYFCNDRMWSSECTKIEKKKQPEHIINWYFECLLWDRDFGLCARKRVRVFLISLLFWL